MANFNKFFHYFYAVSVAYTSMLINRTPDEQKIELLANLEPIRSKGKMAKSASIDSPQLNNHDNLFKTIAYWYRMKLSDPTCYKVLLARDDKEWKEKYDSIMICEEIFAHGWDSFRKLIGTIGTKHPDVLFYLQLQREKEKI